VTRDLRLIALGDSTLLSSGDPEGLGWLGRVAAATRARLTPIELTVYNLGVGGETSVEVRARWDEVERRLAPEADVRLLLSCGYNDTFAEPGAPPTTAPEESSAHLAALLQSASDRRLPAFVAGPPGSPHRARAERLSDLSARFAATCADAGVPFADVVTQSTPEAPWVRDARAGDGTHPGPAGYEALAALVLEAGWWTWLDPARSRRTQGV